MKQKTALEKLVTPMPDADDADIVERYLDLRQQAEAEFAALKKLLHAAETAVDVWVSSFEVPPLLDRAMLGIADALAEVQK